MSRYFFHVFDERATNLVRDSEGSLFSTIDEAKQEAIGLAGDIVGHRLHGLAWQVVVTDDNGQRILSVPLVEIRPNKIKGWLDLIRRMVTYEPRLRPHVFTWLLTAALFATLMQAAVLSRSAGKVGSSSQGASSARQEMLVRVRFIPQATVEDVSKFLHTYKVSLVGRPQLAGMYQLQFSDSWLSQTELDTIVNRMTDEKIVAFASAAP
jgi:hypothetical protein